MENVELEIEKKAQKIVEQTQTPIQIQQGTDVKEEIDILATKTALQQEDTIKKIVIEKQEELKNEAEAKRVQAETERITREVEKVKQEKEKELAELNKVIAAKKAEVEHLNTESDIAQAFFDSNKDILRYIGIREKKSLKTMQTLMIFASIVFVIVQALMFPLTLCGIVIETVVNIIGGVCGAVKNNTIKILLTIVVVLIITAVAICSYYFVSKLF